MLQISFKDFTLEIKFLFVATLTLFLLCDKSGYGLILFLASLIHELGHLIVFFLIGYAPEKVSFELCGIKMEQGACDISIKKEILVLLGGSIANFIMFLCLSFSLREINYISVFAAGHLILGVINLLPLSAFDGGKILGLIFEATLPLAKAQRIVNIVRTLTLCTLFFGGIIVLIKSKGNFSLVILAVYALISELTADK